MKKNIYLYRDALANHHQGSAVTIGNFDGIHLGHQGLLLHLVKVARQKHLIPTVLTFIPHAREFFATQRNNPALAPARILSPRDKIQAIRECGIEHIIVKRFNEAFARLSPQDFIKDILIDQLNVKWLIVGKDFHFGHKRLGDISMLEKAAKLYNFELVIAEDILDDENQRYSSTAVRKALSDGDMDLANELLGHPYLVTGHVIHGQKLGRTLGFPTLNLKLHPLSALKTGVYIVTVSGLKETPIPAVASVGFRPTVTTDGALLLEVHLLDTQIDAYGKLISVSFLKFVRSEEKFQDLEALTNAIQNDVKIAKTYFLNHGL
ncbi:bifunctional riboflavin kinase/FAD synthetase [Basilea psittacipulmonis]|uniref:Riboflavin biosynthesis protein n=1 Tax=Basilea psittacipulmonis DSM 24701 TaxID=1072685 RepID=A0A077DD05_9BURK|nr:bifunctional riboflavin kinase/FAD synthetase [Basilea psittacipulmonis]AIL32494.1 riboflavin kinase [Basilea psittacipulmonis DSM 24701]